MYEIFLKTLPFFALIGVGYISGVTRFFTEEATAYLTKFVFYFRIIRNAVSIFVKPIVGRFTRLEFCLCLPAGIRCRVSIGRVGCALSACFNN